jgi:hypothetical protein
VPTKPGWTRLLMSFPAKMPQVSVSGGEQVLCRHVILHTRHETAETAGAVSSDQGRKCCMSGSMSTCINLLPCRGPSTRQSWAPNKAAQLSHIMSPVMAQAPWFVQAVLAVRTAFPWVEHAFERNSVLDGDTYFLHVAVGGRHREAQVAR